MYKLVGTRELVLVTQGLVMPEIPLDLQIKILSRLPSKTLMRFKCVSRLWSSLIRSRYFTNLYLTVSSPPQPPRLYISSMEQCDENDCDSMPIKSSLVSFSSSSTESFQHECTMTDMGGHFMVAFRGLILYRRCGKACIYNPTTRQRVTLPPVESNLLAQEEPLKYVDYYLGHDHVLDQYKVLCTVTIASESYQLMKSEHWVFVLEVGGCWKRIELDQQPHRPRESGLCINGFIYYLADTSSYNDIVVSFDVKSEELSVIQAPLDVNKTVVFADLIEYRGKPAILYHDDLATIQDSDLMEYGLLELWVLEDGGTWSRKSMVLQPCHMHLVDSFVGVSVKGTTRNGEVIMAPLTELFSGYLLYYDVQKNDLRKVEIKGMPDIPYTDLTLMDSSESIVHLEI